MINDIESYILKLFKQKYNELMNKELDVLYKDIKGQLIDIYNAEDKDLFIKALKTGNIKITKKRWYKKFLENKDNPVMQKIDFAKSEYERVLKNEISQKRFKDYFGSKDAKTFKEKTLKPLEEWKNDERYLLTDYPYLNTLGKKSINAAFKNDIILVFAIKSKDEEISPCLTKIPSILSDIPIDTTSRIDFMSDEQKKALEKADIFDNPSTIDKLILCEEEDQDRILMQLEKMTYLEIKRGGAADKFLDMMTQIALIKSVKYLNATDVKVIRYYYTHFEKMVLGEPIDKTIYQVVMELGMPNTPKFYNLIENSIAKLASVKLSYNIEGNVLQGALLECRIYQEDGVKRAKVYLGQILNELIVKKSTFEYDEETFNSLGADAQQLAIWFQKRRYRAAINNNGYKENITLSRFSNAIYWNTKRKDRQRNRILSALEELLEKNLIIKEFSYNKKIYEFTIEYIPLSPREQSKLQNHNSFNIDGNIIQNTNYNILE